MKVRRGPLMRPPALALLLATLLAGCASAPVKDTSGESPLDSDADTGAPDSDDTGDSGTSWNMPVEEGFESEVTEWQVDFSGYWGARWSVQGTNPTGDTTIVAIQGHGTVSPNTSIVVGVEDADFPVHVVIWHWPGAECLMECDSCPSYGPLGYRAVQGQVEVSFWDDYADFRMTDVVFASEYGGEDVRMPLLEGSGLRYQVCKEDTSGR